MNDIKELAKWLKTEIREIQRQIKTARGGRKQSPKKELYKYLGKLEVNLYKLQTAIKIGQIK